MLIHVSHASRHGQNKIIVRTVDAYVVVLTVSVGQYLQPETALCVVTGTRKRFRHQLAHEIAAGLEPDRAQALTMLYALT